MTNVDVGPGAIVCSEAAITGDVTIGDILQFYDDIDDDRIIEFREAIAREKCSFFEHCSKGLRPPPPLLFEHLSYFAGVVF